MAAQRLQANENGNNNKKGGRKTRSTPRNAAPSTPNSTSDSSDDDSEGTMIGFSPSMSAVNLTEALEDVKTSINETVSTKIDSVFEKTKKYIDKTIKPINTRLEKVEQKAAATEDFAKKSINEFLESHKTIWVSINDLKKQRTDQKAKPPASDLRKQNNLLIKGLELKEGDTPETKVTKMFSDLSIDITGAFNTRKIPGERLLVEFNSCWDKRAAYKARTKLYNNDYKGVYINEDLTEEQADLFFYARAAKKQKLVKSAWTMNGASFIAKTVRGEQEMIEVTSKEHIKALVPKLKMPKAKNSGSKKEPKAWSKNEHEASEEEEAKDPQDQSERASTSSAAQDKSKEDGEVSGPE